MLKTLVSISVITLTIVCRYINSKGETHAHFTFYEIRTYHFINSNLFYSFVYIAFILLQRITQLMPTLII